MSEAGVTYMRNIEVIGARAHNLKNIDLKIPKDSIVVFTGVSGSGKSSLVFDTVYAEAQRQLIETFSSFARRRLPKINRPDVDEIRNITTTITIDQKRMGNNPRSTVGTATEVYTYLRLLFSRAGTPAHWDSRYFGFNNPYGMCQRCKGLGSELLVNVDRLIDMDKSLSEGAIRHPNWRVGAYFYRTFKASNLFPMDKPLREWSKEKLDLLLNGEKQLVKEASEDNHMNVRIEGVVTSLKRRYVNNESAEARIPRYSEYFAYQPCPECHGSRINKLAREVTLNGKTIPELVEMELSDLYDYILGVTEPQEIVEPIVNRIKPILRNLIDIGVGYLSLNRAVGTLSGGESQRVKMARQLGCDLTDITYVFDEPSVGLHQRDIGKLVDILEKIKEKGNNLLVVEHDSAVIENADWVIDMGPGAGTMGGEIVFAGTYAGLLESDSVTAEMLQKTTTYSNKRRKPRDWFTVKDAKVHNLKHIDVDIPKGVFVCITGVAGSGKSSLILDEYAQRYPGSIVIDQSAIGRSTRSNPATYTKIFGYIRTLFSETSGEPRKMFSFNSAGACPKCKGSGRIRVEMGFLETVDIECDECEGKRYKSEVLEHRYNGKNIHEVLQLTASDALEFFKDKRILRRLRVLNEVGLGYITLGQTVSSLSGGEAQRLKLARELNKRGNVYILDEPTTGLHMADIEKLLLVVNRLVDQGNTVIVIEHNLDVIKNSDWVIDMGPEGGNKGGFIIAEGTPEQIAENPDSYTGEYLSKVLLD